MNNILPDNSSWKLVGGSILVIAVIGFAAYANTFSAPMVFDDFSSIVAEKSVHSFDTATLWRQYSTRFVVYATLAANYAFGGLGVWSYHLVNLLIHVSAAIASGWLVMQLSARTHKTRYYKIGLLKVSNHWLLAMLTSLLFVSHPIQTQAVTYIVQRLTSLATLLYILGLGLYVRGRIENNGGRWLIGSVAAILLAMFSKEIAFTAPFAVLLIELIFFSRRQLFKNWLIVLPFLLMLLLIPTIFFVTRVEMPVTADNPDGVIIGSLDEISFRGVTADTAEITRKQYFLTELNVVRTYLRLLVWPANQNLDYDYPITTELSGSVVLSGLLIMSLLGFGIVLVRFNRLAAFGIFFFFLALSVESSVIPISDVIFEHRLYLPSVGFFLTISAGFVFVIGRWAIKDTTRVYITLSLVVVLILTMTVATFKRNMVWRDARTLWFDVTTKSPNKARGHGNLAVEQMKAGELDKASTELQRAMELDPDLPGLHYNLGNLYRAKGDFEEAVKEYEIAFEANSNNISALINSAGVYMKQGEFDKAMNILLKAAKIAPNSAVVFANLGLVSIELHQYTRAYDSFEKALEIDPSLESAKIGLQVLRNK